MFLLSAAKAAKGLFTLVRILFDSLVFWQAYLKISELVSNTKYFLGTNYFENFGGADFFLGGREIFHAVEVFAYPRRQPFSGCLPDSLLDHPF